MDFKTSESIKICLEWKDRIFLSTCVLETQIDVWLKFLKEYIIEILYEWKGRNRINRGYGNKRNIKETSTRKGRNVLDFTSRMASGLSAV